MAWEKAAQELNTNPDKYQNLMIEQGRVPESIKGTYKMPPFPPQGIPSAAETDDVIEWMREKGLIDQDIPYKDLVDAAYLAEMMVRIEALDLRLSRPTGRFPGFHVAGRGGRGLGRHRPVRVWQEHPALPDRRAAPAAVRPAAGERTAGARGRAPAPA